MYYSVKHIGIFCFIVMTSYFARVAAIVKVNEYDCDMSYHGNSYSIHIFIFVYYSPCIRFIYKVDFIVNVTIDKLF